MRNPHEIDARVAGSLSESPSGGRLKMWLLGFLLALVPILYGMHCLWSGHTKLVGGRGASLDLTGSAAVAMAIAYIAMGGYMHAHWFWGLHHKLEPLSPILKLLAVLAFLGGLGYTGYRILAS